ncbi:MAG TPA: DUF4136 domain-containing protein [Bacteroidia bacterium]|nr:DUF4136 domain-containing protein [Bacteroidia bacterium]
MKTLYYSVLFFLSGLFLSGCATVLTGSDKDNTVNFFQYKSFAWYARDPSSFKNDQFDNQIIESNVKNLVSGELKRRGFTVDLDEPDLLINYDLMIEKKTEQVQTPIYYHPYNYGFYNPYRPDIRPYAYPSPIISYQTENIPYKEGTLTISIVDKKTNRLIWRGWGVGTVSDAQTYESELPKAIHEIFKAFPVHVVPAQSAP